MLFFLGYLIGFLNCIILLALSYKIVKYIWPKYGNPIVRAVNREKSELQEITYSPAQIVNPDFSEDIFKNEASNIQDLIK